MIATNAFKQAVVGTYTASDTVIELNSITNTVGNADYLPNGGFNLILYDGLFGNPADANNGGDYEILECTGVNYTDNEITVVRAQENTTAVIIDASSWQVIYGATVAFFAQFEDADATILKQANVVDTLVSTSIIAPLSANQGKQLQDTKIPTADIINDLTTGGATKVLSAEQGVEAKTLIDGKAPIQDTDTWVLNTSFTGSADPITTNLARFGHTDFIGTGMTQASGIFTFPRTGIWRVEFKGSFNPSTDLFYGGKINVITDASGTPVITVRDDSFGQANNTTGSTYCALNGLEVTATADVKVSFAVQVESVGVTVNGGSTVFRTGMIFTRIGDL